MTRTEQIEVALRVLTHAAEGQDCVGYEEAWTRLRAAITSARAALAAPQEGEEERDPRWRDRPALGEGWRAGVRFCVDVLRINGLERGSETLKKCVADNVARFPPAAPTAPTPRRTPNTAEENSACIRADVHPLSIRGMEIVDAMRAAPPPVAAPQSAPPPVTPGEEEALCACGHSTARFTVRPHQDAPHYLRPDGVWCAVCGDACPAPPPPVTDAGPWTWGRCPVVDGPHHATAATPGDHPVCDRCGVERKEEVEQPTPVTDAGRCPCVCHRPPPHFLRSDVYHPHDCCDAPFERGTGLSPGQGAT